MPRCAPAAPRPREAALCRCRPPARETARGHSREWGGVVPVAAHEAAFHAPSGDLETVREALYDVMWEDVGIVRSAASLTRALATLDALDRTLAGTGVAAADRAFNLAWHDWLNLRSLIAVSRVIAQAALAREESRGAHFREDFPSIGPLNESSYIV